MNLLTPPHTSSPVRTFAPALTVPAEARTSSFVLRGLTWRSFTQRRPSQQLAAPPAMHSGQMQQPPASAQITPRVQPSQLPTPRMLVPGAEPSLLPPMANGRSQQLPPLQGLPGKTMIASALEAAAAAEAAGAAGAAAAAEGGREEEGAPGGAQQQQQQQQQQPAPAAIGHDRAAPQGNDAEARPQQPAPAAIGHDRAAPQSNDAEERPQRPELSHTSWRSDAVQLPEQLSLPDGLPASPTSSTDTTGATAAPARVRGRCAVLGMLHELEQAPASVCPGRVTKQRRTVAAEVCDCCLAACSARWMAAGNQQIFTAHCSSMPALLCLPLQHRWAGTRLYCRAAGLRAELG